MKIKLYMKMAKPQFIYSPDEAMTYFPTTYVLDPEPGDRDPPYVIRLPHQQLPVTWLAQNHFEKHLKACLGFLHSHSWGFFCQYRFLNNDVDGPTFCHRITFPSKAEQLVSILAGFARLEVTYPHLPHSPQ